MDIRVHNVLFGQGLALQASSRRLGSSTTKDPASPPSTSKTSTTSPGSRPSPTPASPAAALASGLNSELAQLKARDREVRAHEAAHLAAAGSVATGGAQFTFQRGPDGQLYAVGGEVHIDTSPVPGDPEATIRKARTIRAAALAPANPSAQDRAVAAQASRMEAQARQELAQERADAVYEATAQPASPPSASSRTVQAFAPSPSIPQLLDLFA
ncbi:MAG: catalase [Nitrospirae bacterium]|nr:MAG: catalase [Nitrospirota bacterium]